MIVTVSEIIGDPEYDSTGRYARVSDSQTSYFVPAAALRDSKRLDAKDAGSYVRTSDGIAAIESSADEVEPDTGAYEAWCDRWPCIRQSEHPRLFARLTRELGGVSER